jgi:hypothetical protein
MSPLQLTPPNIEVIDAEELARRLNVPLSWVQEHTRSRIVDPIPHLKLGKFVRFEWGSPLLEEWRERQRRGRGKKAKENDAV